MSLPKSFLFDIGKVLLDFDFEPSLRRLLPPDTIDAAERLSLLLADKDHFEAGTLPLETYLPRALEILAHDVTEEAFLTSWREIFTPNLPMWRDVERLRQAGHRLILFSNTNPIHVPWILDKYDVFRHFDGGVYSFETGHIKPHEPIYRHAIDKHDLDPAETLYIDDLTANIDTGRRLGFRCHQYDLTDHSAFQDWLVDELRR